MDEQGNPSSLKQALTAFMTVNTAISKGTSKQSIPCFLSIMKR